MTDPASATYKLLFGDPQALTPEQQKILDAAPVLPRQARIGMTGWCCEQGAEKGMRMCPDCADSCAAYTASTKEQAK